MNKIFLSVILLVSSVLNLQASFDQKDEITVYVDDHGKPNACELISAGDIHKFKVWSSPEYHFDGRKDFYFITEDPTNIFVQKKANSPFTVDEIKGAVFKHWMGKEANAAFWGSFKKFDTK